MALNGEIVDGLSYLVHKDKAMEFARAQCTKLKDILPRELF